MPAFPISFQWEHVLLWLLSLAVSVSATLHVLLHKKDTRAAIGWIGLIWLSPFVGTVVYVLLGINRIERKARALRRDRPPVNKLDPDEEGSERLLRTLGPERAYLATLGRLGGEETGRRLLGGNRVEPLDGGDEAYPKMVEAIDAARRSVTMLTYIFRHDQAGTPVADALTRARERGVEIRVLVDALGSVHEGAPIIEHLRQLKLAVELFIPTTRPGWMRYANLRNHRKVMVVDGLVGFTGGMNVLDDFLGPGRDGEAGGKGCRDLHFRVEGPLVTTLQQAFADDWAFTTGEVLDGDPWFVPDPQPRAGETIGRIVVDGPDIDSDPLAAVFFGALAVARESATIITPYFIPDSPLSAALASAARRGVRVDIILPRENNHRFVKWAGIPLLEPLLEAGCRVWLTEPPFDHTKLMVVDDAWAFFGSANWDPRSLVLNFELNVECYDPGLASRLSELAGCRMRGALRLTLDEVRDRPLALKLRDSLARLFSPYL
ncbi:cardiolipin synthase [Tautonia plasticadhaerens]|uniref:Cardiolipin synthase n=1 Tax=Tautonia plasticadhaerens TaxID=2527974 RepID=A0A518GWJ0_9BACT|nr:cardiolipin synthase [Tautonia plasticadhaerens]QDV32960.1 Major cardiolipin synthase ClsA [Tautonia plasticadhaerens]